MFSHKKGALLDHYRENLTPINCYDNTQRMNFYYQKFLDISRDFFENPKLESLENLCNILAKLYNVKNLFIDLSFFKSEDLIKLIIFLFSEINQYVDQQFYLCKLCASILSNYLQNQIFLSSEYISLNITSSIVILLESNHPNLRKAAAKLTYLLTDDVLYPPLLSAFLPFSFLLTDYFPLSAITFIIRIFYRIISNLDLLPSIYQLDGQLQDTFFSIQNILKMKMNKI